MTSASGVAVAGAPSQVEAAAFPGDVAAWAASVPPSPVVPGPLGTLDPAKLSQAGQLDAIVALERVASWTAARQIRAIAALAGPPAPGGDPDLMADPARRRLSREQIQERLDKEWIKEDLRAALGESAVGAGNRIRLARELTGRMAPTLTALEAGRIGMRHVHYLLDALLPHQDATAATVQEAVLPDPAGPVGPMPHLAAFRRRVRREIINADPRTAEQQHADARAARRVSIVNHPDGTSTAFALLPTDGAALLNAALDLIASRHAPDDDRTRDQRRADALVQLARDALTGYPNCPHHTDHPDTARAGTGPAVHVTVALSTLLGLDEQGGELNGEPIPAVLARRLAADEDSTWRRLVTDQTGHLIDYGRSTYRPPADLARFVAARDRTCIFPTCSRHACTCELDHTLDWAHDGPTNSDNLAVLCCRHHHGKHDAGWSYQRLPNGDLLWRSPHGHVYRKPAATYPIDHTSEPSRGPGEQEHPATEADPDPPAEQEPPF